MRAELRRHNGEECQWESAKLGRQDTAPNEEQDADGHQVGPKAPRQATDVLWPDFQLGFQPFL